MKERGSEGREKVRGTTTRVRQQQHKQRQHPPMVQNRGRKRRMDHHNKKTLTPAKRKERNSHPKKPYATETL